MNEEKDMSAVDPVREDAERWPHGDTFSRGLVLLVVELVLIVLLLIIVSLRVYSRSYLSRFFGLEDWFIALATVTTLTKLRTSYHLRLCAKETTIHRSSISASRSPLASQLSTTVGVTTSTTSLHLR